MISFIIPARQEPHLQRTIDDLFENAKGDIEVIVGLDGWHPDEIHGPLDRLLVIQEKEPIGQRAMMNLCAEAASGKYIAKTDAHCSFGPGFDTILLEDMDDKTVIAPYLMVLDPLKWTIAHDKHNSSFVFDTNLVMHYGEENNELVNETMCLQGSFFMTHKKNYHLLCDEDLGSWGGQGSELGIKAYLHGLTCKVSKKTYYGHVFRHTEQDFPYKRDLAAIRRSQKTIIEKYRTKKIAGLVKKYNFPKDWTPDFVKRLP